MQESLSVIDSDGTFLFANDKAAANLTGSMSEDIIGKNIKQLIAAEQGEQLVEKYRQAIRSGRRTVQEVKISLPNDERWFYNTLHPVSYGQHKTTAVISMSLDITQRKQAEEERNTLQGQLIQAQKMEAIGTLAGGIAHDFNNILGAILGYAEMARDDCPADSTIANDIDQIIKAGTRAGELVKQILAFSRQAKADPVPLQPAVIISESIKLLRASLPTTIAIRQNIAPDAGFIQADPTQIHQILMNLCTNAYHAMETKGGTLTISLKNKTLGPNDLNPESSMQPGNFVQLSIEDTGVGIEPEIREKIFDPYFTTKEIGKGTGMGLATVHGIVRSYGGSIACDSQPGQGTVFHIILPAVPAHTVRGKESTEQLVIGREHILLIDDEEILVEVGQAMLQRLGYKVTTRTNSIEALATFQDQPETFDLIITDLTMPGMTGVDLARRMLQIRPDMPIILCTGYSNLISEGKAKAMGIRGFAMKPFAKKDISHLIRKVLEREPR
jgi:PAS domain S-box-containing protein